VVNLLKQRTGLATYKKVKLASYVLVLVMLPATFTFGAAVEGVRLWRAPDSTRLVFDLSGPVEHKLFTLGNPDRLVIDINSSQFSAAIEELDLLNTPIKKIRYSTRNHKDLRVVLDLKDLVKPRSFI
jgi:N-acetylmuramoyl-L-alanine amidase